MKYDNNNSGVMCNENINENIINQRKSMKAKKWK